MSQNQTQVDQTLAVTAAIENVTISNQPQMAKKKKIIMPPTWYNLVKISNYDMLSHISYLTNQFRDLPDDVANWIMYDAHQRPYSSFGTIPAPPSTDLVKQIIGINGYYLKLTTQNCLVDFIWHDRVRNEFQFWGEYHSCVKAMNVIRYRICKYVDSYKANNDANNEATKKEKEYVFDNDINPNPAVCLEGIIELDENYEYKRTVASKRYPDTSS